MAVNRAWDNVRALDKAVSLLIKLGVKIDAHQHPQQIDLLFDILRRLDKAHSNQIRVAQAYGKTADRLGLLRGLYQAKYSSSASLGGFLDNIESEFNKDYDKGVKHGRV